MHAKTKRIVITALMTSMVCVATMLIKIPTPLKGYMNLGDCIVLLCGWLLPCGYGFVAAGLGSALADLLSGYAIYAPATFVIKGAMAVVVFVIFKLLSKKIGKFASYIIGGIIAELIMISGYFLFEGVLYGFGASLVNIPANAIQGAAGLVIGTALIKVLDRLKIALE